MTKSYDNQSILEKIIKEKHATNLEEVKISYNGKLLGVTYDDVDYTRRLEDIMSGGGDLIKTELGETALWSVNFIKGIFRKNIHESWYITNFRVIKCNNEKGEAHQLPIKYIDAIVMNQRRISQSNGRVVGLGVFGGISSGMGFSQRVGQSSTIGDLVFVFNGQVLITFENLSDPAGVRKLLYTVKKQLY